MQENNKPAPFYLKYLFFGLLGFCLIGGIFLLINSIEPKEDETTDVGYIYEQIEIKDIDKYPACLILNHEPYWLFEEITVDDSLRGNKITITNSEFGIHKDNMYNDINGATFNYDEGYNIYLLSQNDSLIVDNNYGLGNALFIKDYEAYKEKYKITNRTTGEVRLYMNVDEGDFETFVNMDFESFKKLTSTDFNEKIDKFDNAYLLSIIDSGYTYNYYALYIEETNHIIVYDNLNEIAVCGDLELVVEE